MSVATIQTVQNILDAVGDRYRLRVDTIDQLVGGIESHVVKATGRDGAVVVRVSPRWRSLEELTWAYELATFAKTRVPEALAPFAAMDGSLAFEHDGRIVSVFPFVEGRMLDRTNGWERDAAAALLARLHRTLPLWPSARPRPASRPDRPLLVPNVDPPGLADRVLDEAVARFDAQFRPALAHGDYYRGNVRCINHEIVAVFDWDDASWWTHENELAWSVWEFAQADHAATLDLDRADQFLRTYEASDGPVSLSDRSFIIPFIRDDIRTEIREAAASAEQGFPTDDAAYVDRSCAAFSNLATVTLS